MRSDVKERRIHPRRTYRTKIVFLDEFGEGLFYVYSRDFSLGGIFLDSDIPVSIGSMLFLSFVLPGQKKPLRVTGEVMRRVPYSASDVGGVGVRFAGLSELVRRRLQEFLL